ncbi:sensor histidine kinase [Cloacibacterium sp.]|uniref:sensor histidine kinase n=1 Tax=Cloacibacterium sp. TaxID=1913682 RepID=UPI0039E2F6D8
MLKIKSAEAVNLLLKQQMHPHFLFNSLHTIKILYKDNPELGEEYLVYLADFLRTTITETHSVTATVDEEINLLENYLKMQKMRFDNALQWEIINDEIDLTRIVLPALSLQPLAENAIKHNYFSQKNPLLIIIEIKNGFLKISNNISKKKYADYSVGTGLMNISERYYMWCGEDLEILDDGNFFIVNLKLKKIE